MAEGKEKSGLDIKTFLAGVGALFIVATIVRLLVPDAVIEGINRDIEKFADYIESLPTEYPGDNP